MIKTIIKFAIVLLLFSSCKNSKSITTFKSEDFKYLYVISWHNIYHGATSVSWILAPSKNVNEKVIILNKKSYKVIPFVVPRASFEYFLCCELRTVEPFESEKIEVVNDSLEMFYEKKYRKNYSDGKRFRIKKNKSYRFINLMGNTNFSIDIFKLDVDICMCRPSISYPGGYEPNDSIANINHLKSYKKIGAKERKYLKVFTDTFFLHKAIFKSLPK